MTVEEAFGVVLKKLREERQLSQMEIVRRTGLDRTTVPKYEKGKRSPNLKSILLIANALGISASDLMKQVEQVIEE
ncbi:helix-turn-helix transcriptional regulator [Fulvivirgaceae bacterium BMA10]|uniref:Helix-turn-helix transcriptional regulator n=1 Tax=Splendidivirga corallicola TaxID=3051826 RepID=A0ABT8KLA1_9BACT|nr:helix-turn-helix transcriptional regulator [Fulvivirgaceae bacterium BMA10]